MMSGQDKKWPAECCNTANRPVVCIHRLEYCMS
jgi:hypothetical protein